MYGVTGLRYYRAMCIAIDTVQLLTFIVLTGVLVAGYGYG
jgi:hypothetical protein